MVGGGWWVVGVGWSGTKQKVHPRPTLGFCRAGAVRGLVRCVPPPPSPYFGQGVGWRVSQVLADRGVGTVADLRRVGVSTLGEWVGANLAASLQRLSRGIDDRQLVFEHDRVQKSVGVEVSRPCILCSGSPRDGTMRVHSMQHVTTTGACP